MRLAVDAGVGGSERVGWDPLSHGGEVDDRLRGREGCGDGQASGQ